MLSGCGTNTVAIPYYSTSAAVTKTCQAIIKDLPTEVFHEQRVKSTGSPLGAAWGDPAIVMRCGVPTPSAFNAYSSCHTVDGIDWFLEGQPPAQGDSSDELLTVTTVYRNAAIELVVPASYGTQAVGTSMAQFSDVIKKHTTASKHCV